MRMPTASRHRGGRGIPARPMNISGRPGGREYRFHPARIRIKPIIAPTNASPVGNEAAKIGFIS